MCFIFAQILISIAFNNYLHPTTNHDPTSFHSCSWWNSWLFHLLSFMVEATHILQHPLDICYISYHLSYSRRSLQSHRKSKNIITLPIYVLVTPTLFYPLDWPFLSIVCSWCFHGWSDPPLFRTWFPMEKISNSYIDVLFPLVGWLIERLV